MKIYLLKKKETASFEKEVKDKEYLFDQWSYQIKRDDIESESNPSEDELTAVERKEKVMEAKPAKKKAKPVSKKKIKKPFEEDLTPFARLNASIDEKHNLLFEDDSKNLSKKLTTGPVIVRKKI